MKFTVIINNSPFADSHSGYFFVKALLESKHELSCVFFYQDASLVASNSIDFPSDETSITRHWQELKSKYDLNLLVCSSAAMRRGVLSQHVLPEFKLVNIGSLLNACDESDRVVTFK